MSAFTAVENVTRASDERPTIRIGVFVPTSCQLLDAAGIDIFGSLSHDYLSFFESFFPPSLISTAPLIKIHFIGSVPAGGPIPMTANLTAIATNHYDDPAVAPGNLDIIYVPGPDPEGDFPVGAIEWLRRQGNTEGVDVLSVCTGIFLCGAAGLLEGRDICGPRGMQERIREKGFGPKRMLGHELRWVQDGNFWSSGGVTNGNDLVAAYCRASPHRFNPKLVEVICELLDVGDRPQKYSKELSASLVM